MKKLVVIVSFLVIPGLVGAGVYWKRTHDSLEYNLARARELIGSQQGDELLDRLVKNYPDSAEVHYLRSIQLGYDQQYERAEDSLNQAAALGWPRKEVERQRALLRSDVEFRGEAEQHLQTLLDANPHDREVLLHLARGYLQHGRLNMAESLTNRVLEQNEEDGAAYCLRGQIRLRRKQLDEASADFDRALRRGKGMYWNQAAWLGQARCYRLLGQRDRKYVEKAYHFYQKCRAEQPRNLNVLYELALCADYIGKSDEALDAYNAILRLRPNHVESMLQKAYIYDRMKKLDKALELLKKIEEEEPDHPQMLAQMAKTLKRLGDDKGAARYQKRFQEVQDQMQKAASEHEGMGAPPGGAPPAASGNAAANK